MITPLAKDVSERQASKLVTSDRKVKSKIMSKGDLC